MSDFLLSSYPYIKSLHVVSIIAWMAGMLYLPRLFVYHAQAEVGSEMSETFKIMEGRLLRIIMNPAMIITWILGITMILVNPVLLEMGWIHAKFLAVFILTGKHHMNAC